jgi:hypothetical protein
MSNLLWTNVNRDQSVVVRHESLSRFCGLVRPIEKAISAESITDEEIKEKVHRSLK